MSELQTSVKSEFDAQDALLIAGFVSLETGVAFVYWPAAFILAGLLCFGFAYLIERARPREVSKEKHGTR